MKKNRAVVTVHGREYTLLGEEPTDYMQRVAAYVDRRMSEISFSAPLSEDRLMALTALNLADELLRGRRHAPGDGQHAPRDGRPAQEERRGRKAGVNEQTGAVPPFSQMGERLPFFC